ncbi:MAG: hypothetical protein ACQKBV_09660 [Puniceicoccales bacterium]
MPWNPFARRLRVETAALGKHPLFPDFIEWRGDTGGGLLRELKPICHECMFPEFTSGKLDPTAPPNLIFAAWSPKYFHLARVMASRDSAGRNLIPFMCAVRGPSNPINYWFTSILPQLDRNAELMMTRTNPEELEAHWQAFSTQLDCTWDRLIEQERLTKTRANTLEEACHEDYWRDRRFASGLYRILTWLPTQQSVIERRHSEGGELLLLPMVTDSAARSTYFWLLFLSHILPPHVTITAVANRTHKRISVVSGFFPKRLFERLHEPTEHGAFYHELPHFEPSGAFLGLLQQVRDKLKLGQLPTLAQLQM